jgi:sulfite reductase alpha subunit-like flavoprotein
MLATVQHHQHYGATDVPAMKMLNYQGGTSIGVYPPNTKGAKTKARELLQNNRANYIAKADYSNGSEIDQIVKSILDQISLKASVKQYTE